MVLPLLSSRLSRRKVAPPPRSMKRNHRDQRTPSLLKVPCDLLGGDARNYDRAPLLKSLSNARASRAASASYGDEELERSTRSATFVIPDKRGTLLYVIGFAIQPAA